MTTPDTVQDRTRPFRQRPRNPHRIAALGVCASAGYTAVSAATDPHVKALALVAPWRHNAAIVRDIYGGEEGVAQRIQAGEQARRRYEQTGEAASMEASLPAQSQAESKEKRGAVRGRSGWLRCSVVAPLVNASGDRPACPARR